MQKWINTLTWRYAKENICTRCILKISSSTVTSAVRKHCNRNVQNYLVSSIAVFCQCRNWIRDVFLFQSDQNLSLIDKNKKLLWEWKFTNDDEDNVDCVSINYNILARAPPPSQALRHFHSSVEWSVLQRPSISPDFC